MLSAAQRLSDIISRFLCLARATQGLLHCFASVDSSDAVCVPEISKCLQVGCI